MTIDEFLKWSTLIGVVLGFASSFMKFGQQKQILLDNAKETKEAKETAITAQAEAKEARSEAQQAALELVNLRGTITIKLDKLDAMRETVVRIDEKLLGMQKAFDEMRQLKKT